MKWILVLSLVSIVLVSGCINPSKSSQLLSEGEWLSDEWEELTRMPSAGEFFNPNEVRGCGDVGLANEPATANIYMSFRYPTPGTLTNIKYYAYCVNHSLVIENPVTDSERKQNEPRLENLGLVYDWNLSIHLTGDDFRTRKDYFRGGYYSTTVTPQFPESIKDTPAVFVMTQVTYEADNGVVYVSPLNKCQIRDPSKYRIKRISHNDILYMDDTCSRVLLFWGKNCTCPYEQYNCIYNQTSGEFI